MPAPKNPIKARMAKNEMQIGVWLGSGSATMAEICGNSGYDWALIDAEHGPSGTDGILAQLQALAGTGTPVVVRVPVQEDWLLKRVLDMGVQTVLVPMVHTAEQAARAVAACKYPPDGIRGVGAGQARATAYGTHEDYLETANDQICVIVQAESVAAVDNIDAIAAVDGVDAVFVGPSDLSADMGFAGQEDAPEVQAVIDHLFQRIKAAGKTSCIISFDPDSFAGYQSAGVTFLAVAGDVERLTSGLRKRRDETARALKA